MSYSKLTIDPVETADARKAYLRSWYYTPDLFDIINEIHSGGMAFNSTRQQINDILNRGARTALDAGSRYLEDSPNPITKPSEMTGTMRTIIGVFDPGFSAIFLRIQSALTTKATGKQNSGLANKDGRNDQAMGDHQVLPNDSVWSFLHALSDLADKISVADPINYWVARMGFNFEYKTGNVFPDPRFDEDSRPKRWNEIIHGSSSLIERRKEKFYHAQKLLFYPSENEPEQDKNQSTKSKKTVTDGFLHVDDSSGSSY